MRSAATRDTDRGLLDAVLRELLVELRSRRRAREEREWTDRLDDAMRRRGYPMPRRGRGRR